MGTFFTGSIVNDEELSVATMDVLRTLVYHVFVSAEATCALDRLLHLTDEQVTLFPLLIPVGTKIVLLDFTVLTNLAVQDHGSVRSLVVAFLASQTRVVVHPDLANTLRLAVLSRTRGWLVSRSRSGRVSR